MFSITDVSFTEVNICNWGAIRYWTRVEREGRHK